MIFDVSADLTYRFAQPCDVLLLIEASDGPDQVVLGDRLTVEPFSHLTRDCDRDGQRRTTFLANGDVTISYQATVERRGQEDDGDRTVAAVRDLPGDALPYLWPSRYCPSDRFERFVERSFGGLRDAALIEAIMNWTATHLEYRMGASNSLTDAMDTFVDRVGVCRDYAHLAICLLRASGVPARAVSAYAWSLEPPDMHAVVEAFIGGRWRLFDPTGRAPVEGLVRVATGADAAHIAFMTIFGSAWLQEQAFRIARRPDAPLGNLAPTPALRV